MQNKGVGAVFHSMQAPSIYKSESDKQCVEERHPNIIYDWYHDQNEIGTMQFNFTYTQYCQFKKIEK